MRRVDGSSGAERSSMRRLLTALAAGLLAVGLLGIGLTSAASAARTCPPAASGFVPYPINGSPGDPAPGPGAEPLWDILVAGADEEGLTVAELAASFELDVDGLYNLALDGWLVTDKNGDSNVCVREFPPQNQGWPAYFFTFIDNKARVPG